MTRYFFQLMTPSKSFTDDLGEEFASLVEAEEHARAVASELGRNYVDADLTGRAVLLLDREGNELLCVPLQAQTDDDADGDASQRALH